MDGAIIRKRRKGDKNLKAKIDPEVKAQMERERRLADNWAKTGKCTGGDMNITRHANTP